jgi:uncharacterized membrane protein SpoIIM required for sporulation
MIVDLARFVEKERPVWKELEKELQAIHDNLVDLRDLKRTRRLLSLFQRACSDLARIGASNAEPELRSYLEALVARGYVEIHSTRSQVHRFRPLHWFVRVFPITFRKNIWGFHLSVALTVVGMLVGAILLQIDPDGRKIVLAPFSHVATQTPTQRVQAEEKANRDRMERFEKHKTTFSGMLMQNNISVSIRTMALGLTFGLGTMLMLFYNGVILGGVMWDYMSDGQTKFMLGWLLPHGSIEIPSILLAGQAGFVLGRAMIGWGTREGLRSRLRSVVPDLATLIGGVAIMLVWAGLMEAFMSQYHEPVLPYSVKIAFGFMEIVALSAFLTFGGKELEKETNANLEASP